jgi:FkbM family methyltransferase
MFLFKSQKGQDAWVLRVLRFKRNGFFVDLAATDGRTHSNSYVLERLFRWRGICIEPNPRYHDALRSRCCHVEHSVIDSTDGVVPFRVDNGFLGGIVADDTDNSPAIRGEQMAAATILDLPARPLIHVLDQHHAPRVIDYLSLDVEGAEERVLLNFPFDRYTFRCMTIERPTPALNQRLFAAGYVFVKNHLFDTFYVHASLSNRVRPDPFEQVPAKDW